MAALLVGLSVMGIMLSMALLVWRTAATREREAELVFRGEQYAQAIELFSRRNGGFPLNLDVLEEGRYIRKLYKDPMTPDGEFQPVYFGQPLPGQIADPEQTGRGGAGGGTLAPPSPLGGGQAGGSGGAGPIIGVVSMSSAESLRLYNGRGHYNEWAFVAIAATAQAGAPGGAQTPGPVPGGAGVGPGAPGGPGGGARPGNPPGGSGPGGAGRGGFPFPGR